MTEQEQTPNPGVEVHPFQLAVHEFRTALYSQPYDRSRANQLLFNVEATGRLSADLELTDVYSEMSELSEQVSILARTSGDTSGAEDFIKYGAGFKAVLDRIRPEAVIEDVSSQTIDPEPPQTSPRRRGGRTGPRGPRASSSLPRSPMTGRKGS